MMQQAIRNNGVIGFIFDSAIWQLLQMQCNSII